MLTAIEHIRRMRGGAQAQMYRADDGEYYIVKFANNPQDRRVLANEWLACRLARRIGLNVPEVALVNVPAELAAQSPLRLAGRDIAPESGIALGSRLVGLGCLDYLPEAMLQQLRKADRAGFVGVLAFDKWACNSDGRQCVFTRSGNKWAASFIDFGYCFNAGEWNFPDSPLRGVYAYKSVYSHVQSWRDFEPWLSRIEALTLGDLWTAADGMPSEWWRRGEEREQDLGILLDSLYARRLEVRKLIAGFRDSSQSPFPNWLVAPMPVLRPAAVASAMA